MPESQVQPISLRNHANGVILESSVDEFLLPEGSVSYSLNFNYDKIGSATVRPGYLVLGDQMNAGDTVVGLHNFLDEGAGTDDRLIAVVDTVVYYLSGSTWTSKRTSLTADAKADFTSFVDQVFMVNGQEASAVWSGASGDSFVTNANAMSAPVGNFVENFRSRVWIANTAANPSRLTYSSVASSSGTILWSGSDFGFIDVAPGDGEDITGIKKFSNALLVFKKNFTYRVFSVNETDPDPKIFVGTYSNESIELGKDGVYFHHPSGIFRMTGNGAPVEISKPINNIIENVVASYYTEVSSWHDSDHVYFSLGDVTMEGQTVTNCVVRWTISTEVWAVYSYADEFHIGASYDNGTNIVQVVGGEDGYVYTFNSGASDNGAAINYHLETKYYTFSGLRSETKTIRRLSALHTELTGAQLGWKNGNHSFSEIQPIGTMQKQEQVFDNQDVKGNRIKFVVSGASAVQTGSFQGLEILEWINEGVID